MDIFDDSDDSDVEFLNLPVNNIRNRRRTFKARINLDLVDNFQLRFRLSRQQFDVVLEAIADRIRHPTGKSGALSPEWQLMICIRFLATGSFYHVLGDSHGVSQATISRCVHKCVHANNDALFATTIHWPENCHQIPVDFFDLAGMPAVAGCVDGTHVRLESPFGNEEQYVNQHGYHSVN